jgi:hypothetical protein
MQAVSLPASAGLQWIIQGWALFRRQPLALFSWAMSVTLLLIIATYFAPIGPIIFIMLMPAITLMTLSIARHVHHGDRLTPGMWFEAVRVPGVLKKLLVLGALYVCICIAVGLLAFLPFAAELTQAMQTLSTTQDVAPLISAVRAPMMIFAVLYFILAALFWYSPVLIGWRATPIGQALFFSAIACWRNKFAFVIYGACWAAIFFVVDMIITLFVSAGIPVDILAALQVPINVALGSVLYASFYPTYVSVFEQANPRV